MRTKIILDAEELRIKYGQLKTIDNVADYFQVSRSTIRKKFKEFGITFNNTNKFKVDEQFFNRDTPDSFYIAGFIAADGCVGSDLSIRLSTIDRRHLEKINEALRSDRSIRDYKNNYNGVSVLRISSSQILKDLLKFNIVERKSLIYEFPDYVINHPLKSHFMRGYFDGDGSFYIQNQYNEKVCFGLRGTRSFLSTYRSILEKECDLKHRKTEIPLYNNCGQLAYGGNRNILKISHFLYQDAEFFLQRKKDIAMIAEKLIGNLYVQKEIV
jgi:AraC-like DNA-binding protein